MAINVGKSGNGGFRRGRRKQRLRIERGQSPTPIRPLENPFPSKGAFRLGTYCVAKEEDDYLVCEGYDPRAKNPFAEITPLAPRTIKVAKPSLLQKTPWDGEQVVIGGLTYSYEYDDNEKGVRTATWTDSEGVEQEEEQRIETAYFVGDTIVAIEVGRNAVQDGMVVNSEIVKDEDGAVLSWVDLNISGRRWKSEDRLQPAIGKTQSSVTAGNTVSVSLYKNIQSSPMATAATRTCHAFVDIDSGKYVSTWKYDDGFYCSPLECNG